LVLDILPACRAVDIDRKPEPKVGHDLNAPITLDCIDIGFPPPKESAYEEGEAGGLAAQWTEHR
jgi:hypothetical protein